jgi:hypothetical protein
MGIKSNKSQSQSHTVENRYDHFRLKKGLQTTTQQQQALDTFVVVRRGERNEEKTQ